MILSFLCLNPSTSTQAYERFLSLHPEYRDSVVLLEVIGGSYNAAVEKRELRAQVMDEVRNIHRLYGTLGWIYIVHKLT